MRKFLKRRIYAFLMDLVVIYLLKFITLTIYLRTLGVFVRAIPLENKENLFSNLYLLNSFLLITIFVGYFTSCFFITEGRTLGKLLFNLKVSTTVGNEVVFDQYLLRTFTYLFCFLNGLFLLLIPFLTKSGKGLPDWISGTEVISEPDQRLKSSEYTQNEAFNLKRYY